MEEKLVSLNIAKLAKEKGFNVPLNIFNNVFDLGDEQPMYDVHRDTLMSSLNTWILRPSQSLIQKWLREDYNITLLVGYSTHPDDIKTPFKCLSVETINNGSESIVATYFHKTYEEALEKGLQEALKSI